MDREHGHLPFLVTDTISDLIWIKIVTIGNPGVGKTCIMKHYCEDKFTPSYQPTVGVDYGFKIHTINDVEVRAHLWDLSGHSDYTEVRNELYRDTEALFLVYDVTNRASFDGLDNWLQEASKCGADSAFLAVVANKIDLKSKRAVTSDEGTKWAASRRIRYLETSALSGEGIQTLFTELLTASVKRHTTKGSK